MFTREWFEAEEAKQPIDEKLALINSKMAECCDFPIKDEEYKNIHEVYHKVHPDCKNMWLYRKDDLIELQREISDNITPVFENLIQKKEDVLLVIPEKLQQRGLEPKLTMNLLKEITSSLTPDPQEHTQVLNGFTIMLAEEMKFFHKIQSTTLEELAKSEINGGRIYEPMPGSHTYQQDSAWMLAHFHHQVQDIIVWDDILPKNMLRSSTSHIGELSGFGRELVTALNVGYKLIDITEETKYEKEAKNGAKFILRHPNPEVLSKLDLYQVLMKDQKTAEILVKLGKEKHSEINWEAEFSAKVVLCENGTPLVKPQIIALSSLDTLAVLSPSSVLATTASSSISAISGTVPASSTSAMLASFKLRASSVSNEDKKSMLETGLTSARVELKQTSQQTSPEEEDVNKKTNTSSKRKKDQILYIESEEKEPKSRKKEQASEEAPNTTTPVLGDNSKPSAGKI